MTQSFPRYASAEFAFGTGGQRVKIENVPCDWNPATGDMDSQCALAVARYVGTHELTQGLPVTLVWVSSSPA
jgi:hypothetical protein